MYDVPYCDDDDMIMNRRVPSPEDPHDEVSAASLIIYLPFSKHYVECCSEIYYMP
jgi:hypothetical protein